MDQACLYTVRCFVATGKNCMSTLKDSVRGLGEAVNLNCFSDKTTDFPQW